MGDVRAIALTGASEWRFLGVRPRTELEALRIPATSVFGHSRADSEMASADVHFLFPEADFAGSRVLRDRMAKTCKERGWQFFSRGVRTFNAPSGRPIPLVQCDFAAGLYDRIHRTRVAVLVLGSDPRVPLHPKREDALRYGRHIQLKRYVEYKCHYSKVSSDPLNDSWAGVFAGWCAQTACDGEQDPRCLPFHVFEGRGEGLASAISRQEFNDRYGNAIRVDDSKSTWRLRPAMFHGTECLNIAGYPLPQGFHWDVDTAGPRNFNTPRNAWRVTGHFNVYPDAFLRRGSGKVQDLGQ